HDAAALDRQPDAGEGLARRQLLPEPRERAAYAARRHPGVREASSRAEKDEILEGEEQLAMLAALGREEPVPNVSAKLTRGHPEKTADLFGGVPRHRPSG